MLDFGVIPPEVNSARMYTGPGAGPMLAAAAAWDELAANLDRSAADTMSLVRGTCGIWRGPSSEEMAAKLTQYVEWLSLTGFQAQSTASQARAAAAAYGTAFAATVPPEMVALNRAELAILVETNILGQNTAAIAANEAEYSEFWAQDAAAMYSYASSSAQATQLQSFSQPVSASAVPAATTSSSSGTSISDILQQLLSMLSSASISFDPFNDVWSASMMSSSWIAAMIQGIPAMMAVANGSSGGGGYNPAVQVPNPAAPPVIDFQPDVTGPAAPGRVTPKPSAHVGDGERIGGMSVPPGWANAIRGAETPPAAPFVPYGGGEEGAPLGVMPFGGRGTGGTSEERQQQPKYRGYKVEVLPKV